MSLSPIVIYTLSLHDALPIFAALAVGLVVGIVNGVGVAVLNIQPFIMTLATMVAVAGLALGLTDGGPQQFNNRDWKSTRLNSSHVAISYAVFCLKQKTQLPMH